MLKALQSIAGSFGIQINRRSSVPFGSNPYVDLKSLAPGLSLAFDVGGNIGQTVETLRRIFPDARIISFEPVPEAFQILSAKSAGDAHVECLPFALGETPGTASMAVQGTSGQNTLFTPVKHNFKTTIVQVETLDGFCEERGIESVDFVKIDVEGFEPSVLRGARRMLQRGAVRFVLAECEFTPSHEEPHGDFFEIARILMPLGYRIVAFYSGGVDGDGWKWGDVLFMRPDGRRALRCSPHT